VNLRRATFSVVGVCAFFVIGQSFALYAGGEVYAASSASSISAPAASKKDPLPSWSAGPHKERIISFVEAITNPQSKTFVPVTDRFATFDNDGTILCEKPSYFEVIFTRDHAREVRAKHPAWAEDVEVQKFLTASDDDLANIHTSESMKVMAETADDITESGLHEIAEKWLNTAQHPRFKCLYKSLHYKPMLELLSYLQANDFQNYICSGGQAEFMRCYIPGEYDIPVNRIIGSNLEFSYGVIEGRSVILSRAKLQMWNVGANKPITILEHIGKRPVIACGNSDGDLEMLTYAGDREGPSLSILVHHDDQAREYQYDRGAEKVLPLAEKKGWLVVSMKDDFKSVFALDR
jgi:phosphoserine phosphatase